MSTFVPSKDSKGNKLVAGEFKLPDVAADNDPRETVIELWDVEGPVTVNGSFLICDDAETFCVSHQPEFTVQLERDPEAGRRSA